VRGHRAAVDPGQAGAAREGLHVQVLGNRQVREQVQFLMDEADAGGARVLRCARNIGLAGEAHPACFGHHAAAEDVHQRRLARAVLAE
jgi:hypothetical protein